MSGPGAIIQSERRPVTVLFCDLVDSTSLAFRLTADEFQLIQRELDHQGRQAATMYGGDYRGLEGDGVIISFGAAGAQESDQERAVRCGLDLIRRIAAMHSVLPFAGRLIARIGIDTDRAYVGPAPGNDKVSLVSGLVTIVASRLKEVTEPGTVLVTEAIWSRVRPTFAGHYLGAKQLKGVPDPVKVWRIDGEFANREPFDTPGAEAPLIGRKDEQALLRDGWRKARQGEPQFILLVGEGGIGKSRLARALRDELAPEEKCFILRSTYDSRNQPFHPVVVFLEHLFRIENTDGRDARLEKLSTGLANLGIADAVPFLARLLVPVKEDDAVPQLSPVRRRARTLSLLIELFSALCRNNASLFIFEDVHWVDASTVDLIREMVGNIAGVRMLALFTGRPDELDRSWSDMARLQAIALDRLPGSDARQVARAAAGAKPLLPHEESEILLRSDCVPLYIEELTRYVLEAGGLKKHESLPVQVHARLMPRIDRLGDAKPTAQIAAVIGREFSFSLLKALSERGEADLRADLQQIEDAGLAWPSVEGDPDSYVFKHSLVQNVTYDTVLFAKREVYHKQIAALLQGQFSRLATDRDDLIASHLEKAKQNDAAVTHWKKAGMRAQDRLATKEAKTFFQSALNCSRRLPPSDEQSEQELGLLQLLAPLLMTIDGWASNEVKEACREGRALAKKLFDLDPKNELMGLFLYVFVWGQWSVGFLRGELVPAVPAEVRGMAEHSGNPVARITARHATSFTHLFRGELEEALAEADAGLALFNFELERDFLVPLFKLSSSVCLHTSRALALWMLGRIPEANQEEAKMLRLARKLGHLSYAGGLGFALMIGGIRYFHTGRMNRLRPIAEKLRRISHDEEFAMWHAVAEVYCGVLDELAGKPGGRARMLSGAQQFSERCNNRITLVLMYVLIAETLHATGESDEALKWLTNAEQEMTSRGERLAAPEIWRVRGRIFASQGNDAGAQQAYTQAIALAVAQEAKSLELRAERDLEALPASRGRQPGLSPLQVLSSQAAALQPISKADQITSADFHATHLQ